MSYHKNLTLDRWKEFDRSDQIIMVANEIVRARAALKKGSPSSARLAYLRALDLFDLITKALERPPLGHLREYRRWREILAAAWAREPPDLAENMLLLKTLLLFTRRSARQIPFVCKD